MAANILIVEDERAIAILLAKIAEECGGQVHIAYDGAQAIRLLETQPFDLLLLDLIMPIVSGEEVLQHMASHQQLKKIPVIVLTTKDSLATVPVEKIIFMPKPFKPQEVKKEIQKILSQKASGN